jgi:hypothetical protein
MDAPSDPAERDVAAELRAVEAQATARRARLARSLRYGSLLVAASFLFFLRGDLRYALRPSAPLELGGPLEFNLDREGTEQYASIVALPGELSATVEHMGGHFRMFGLLGTNVVVMQNLAENAPEAMPARNVPFHAAGRLVRDDDAMELRRIFELMEDRGVVVRQEGHLYVLHADELPRHGVALPLELLGIVLFVLVNWRAAYKVEHPLPELADDDAPASDG